MGLQSQSVSPFGFCGSVDVDAALPRHTILVQKAAAQRSANPAFSGVLTADQILGGAGEPIVDVTTAARGFT